MAVTITYSPAPPEEGVHTLRKYRELALMPIVFSLLGLSARHCKLAQTSFLGGSIVLMTVSYLIYFGLVEESRYGYSLVFHITHSFFMAVLGYWALHKATSRGWPRYAWLIVCAAAVINLFYIAPGRTGMFVFCCLILLFLFQRLNPVKFGLALVAFVLLLMTAYQTSDNFSGRVNEALSEITHYEPGKSRTSVGQRFDWWMISTDLIQQKPILGHGAGSYERVHTKAIRGKAITPTDNPHNELLFLWVQFGLIGVALFLLLIILQIHEAQSISRGDRLLLHGVVVALLAGSLMNSLLFDSQQGHFYLFMSAALLAGE